MHYTLIVKEFQFSPLFNLESST